MKILDYEQGTEEWKHARAGIPSASQFKRICTPAKMDYARGADTYRNELLQEQIQGFPRASYSSAMMDRGVELEDQALAYYAFDQEVELEKVGFCLHDSEKYGCSPDALVKGMKIGVEAKSPDLDTHIGYLIKGGVPLEYKIQVLGSLLVTRYEQWDFISYHPDAKPLLIKVKREDVADDLAILEKHLNRFCNELIRYKAIVDAN